MQGRIEEINLSSILQLLLQQDKPGTLYLRRDDEQAFVHIKNNKIVSAGFSDIDRKDEFNRILLKRRLISEGKYKQALVKQAKTSLTEKELIGLGLIDKDKLRKLKREYTIQVLSELLSWQSGEFNYASDDQVVSNDQLSSDLTAEFALMESFRRMDEFKRLRDMLPSPDTILVKKTELGTSVTFTKDEKSILMLVDGNRKLKTIIKEAPLEPINTMHILHDLLERGMLKETSKPSRPVRPVRIEVRDVSLSNDRRVTELLDIYKTIVIQLNSPKTDERIDALKVLGKIYINLHSKNRPDIVEEILSIYKKILINEKVSSILVVTLEILLGLLKFHSKRKESKECRAVLTSIVEFLKSKLRVDNQLVKRIFKRLEELELNDALIPVVDLLESPFYQNETTILLVSKGESIAPLLLTTLFESESRSARMSILRILRNYVHLIIEQLIDGLNHDSWFIRRNCCHLLAHAKDNRSVERLLELLRDEAHQVRESAANALAAIMGSEAEPHLLELLDDKEKSVQMVVVKLLQRIGTKKSAPVIASRLKRNIFGIGDIDDEIKCEICRTLGEIGSSEVIDTLGDIIKETYLLSPSKHRVQAFACRALGKIGDTRAKPILKKAVKSRISSVSIAAKKALRDLEKNRT